MAQKVRYKKKKKNNAKGVKVRKPKGKQAIKILVYIAHRFGGDINNLERAKKITHDLQVNDLENTYICPLLTFSHLQYDEIGYDNELEACIDLLSVCDKLIVASDLSEGVEREITLAEKCNMEIEYLEDTE